jgi:hypothetical protein
MLAREPYSKYQSAANTAQDWSWRYAAASDYRTLQGCFVSFAACAGGGGAATRSPPAKRADARGGCSWDPVQPLPRETQLMQLKPGLGRSSHRGVELKNKNWAKLCRDCGLVEGWAVGGGASAEIDLVFASHITPGHTQDAHCA